MHFANLKNESAWSMLHFCFLFLVLAVEQIINVLEDQRSATETIEAYLQPPPGSSSFAIVRLCSLSLIFEGHKGNNKKNSPEK